MRIALLPEEFADNSFRQADENCNNLLIPYPSRLLNFGEVAAELSVEL
jgi:hypothetical protein